MNVVTRVAQETIPFLGTAFAVILGSDGERYMSIAAICDLLELQAGPQKRRIKRNATLLEGLRILAVTTAGGDQPTNCLNIETMHAWLAGVQTDSLSPAHRNMLALLVSDLVPLARSAFPDHQVPDTTHSCEPISPQPIEDVQERSFLTVTTEHQALLHQLATTQPGTHLLVPSAMEDAAFRESCLADETAWNMSSNAPHFISTENVTVYLVPPGQSLDKEAVSTRLRALGERTVITARIALGLWNIRRHDPRFLQKNGSVPIGVEEILEWRGIAKHSREAYPGSSTRETDGFETKYRQQVYEDFAHLQHCYMYNAQGVPMTFEGPYAHVTVIRGQRTLWSQSDEEIIAFLFAPGGWIASQTGQALSQFAVVLTKIFQLKPQRHQIALRLALYLVERWSELSMQGDYDRPLSMLELLRASMIGIDTSNISRFSTRITQGIRMLRDLHILGEVQEYVPPFETKMTLQERFLSTHLSLPPHEEVLQKYQEIARHLGTRSISLSASASFLPQPPGRRGKKTAKK